MQKEEFLRKLRKKLDLLAVTEVDAIILEYSTIIEEKIKSGLSEKDAVASLGDIDDLANELLKTYKINPQYKGHDPIGTFSKKVVSYVDQIMDVISKKKTDELVRMVIELLLFLFLIILCHIPIQILEDLGKDVFYILSNPLNQVFYTIWKFVLEFAYFILSLLVVARIIKRRYLKDENIKPVITKEKVIKQKPLKNKVSNKHTIGETIIKILVIFFKFFAICVLFGLSVYLIVLGVFLGLCFYFLLQGITYFGFYIVMICLFFLGIIFFQLLFNFVLDRPFHPGRMMIMILILFVCIGFGSALATYEVAQTKYYDQVPDDLKTEVITEELPYQKDSILIGNISEYIIDENLDNIIVTYRYYPIGTKMRSDIKKEKKEIYLDWKYENIHINKELINHMIDDLKKKEIYSYSLEPKITIKGKEKYLNIIKTNRQNYYKNQNKYSTCEFIRTYHIMNIQHTKTGEYVYVTLSSFLEDDIYTAKIKTSLAENLVVNYDYEFTFQTYQSYIDSDIEEVFHDANVLNIHKTNKVGKDQIQDTSCSVFY